MRKIIGIFVITLLLATALPLVSGDNPVLLNTIIVPDDYPTIKEAINNANNGDTIFVRAGTYYENLAVDKSITLIGENRETTIIDADGEGNVILITADYTSVSGFTITNSGSHLPPPPNFAGVWIKSSYNNISYNIISNNMVGIYCDSSNYNTFRDNIFNNDSIRMEGYLALNYIHDIQGNSVNGKPLYYYYNKDNFNVPSDAGPIILFRCSNVMISGLNIDSSETGIKLIECNSCTIQKSNISNMQWIGIELDTSNGIIIQDNTIFSAGAYGIFLTTSYFGEIKNNLVSGDTWIGIAFFQFCQFNEITDNTIDIESSHTILEHPSTGIWLRAYCSNNNVIENNVKNCQIGLWIGQSHHNNIQKNLLQNCHIISTLEQTKSSKEFKITKNKENTLPLTARGAGIYLVETGENDITFNTISENDIGVIIYRSWMDNIQFNNIMDSTTGFDFIALLSLGYYPFNYWGSSITGPIMKSNRLFTLFPWSPIRISEAP